MDIIFPLLIFFGTSGAILVAFAQREGWEEQKGLVYGLSLIFFVAICCLGLGEYDTFFAACSAPFGCVIVALIITGLGKIDR